MCQKCETVVQTARLPKGTHVNYNEFDTAILKRLVFYNTLTPAAWAEIKVSERSPAAAPGRESVKQSSILEVDVPKM